MERLRRLAVAVPLAVAALAFAPAFAGIASAHGYDVSWPQCGNALPSDGDFRIVGVTGGKPYDENPCLADQYRWAAGAPSGAAFYMNTANPGAASQVVDWYGQKAPNNRCSRSNEAACAYNYGYNAALRAFAYAQKQTGAAGRHSWWLDIETTNSWSGDHELNMGAIVGSIDALRTKSVPVGLYSTDYQWGRITGHSRLPDLPNWVAGATSARQAAAWCGPDSSFTGGQVVLIQWVEDDIDHNHACAPLPTASAAAAPANPLDALLKKLLRDLGLLK